MIYYSQPAPVITFWFIDLRTFWEHDEQLSEILAQLKIGSHSRFMNFSFPIRQGGVIAVFSPHLHLLLIINVRV